MNPFPPPQPADPDDDGGGRASTASGRTGTIGRYRIVGRLGVGGMGEVLLARSSGASGFEKDVVLKRILPHLATDPDFVTRFIEEGKLVVKLRHAGIAQVLDMGEEDGVVFIAMEHVDGKDMGELLKLAGSSGLTMPRELVMFVLIELLEALDYAHHAKDTDGTPLGLIHRDVTPSNVMISKSGEVKLLDFGIARATERLKTSVSGAIRGKYSYMSPQQAAGLELDPRSDLFSVGVIAWELLAGSRPFDGASDLLTLDRVRTLDPGPLTALVPDVPVELSDWVAQMLAKTPDERFPSAHEAAQELRRQLMSLGLMPTGRELAAWFESVVATLPEGLKHRPVQGLSLDEVLLMGLGPEPRGPGTVVATPETPASEVAAPAVLGPSSATLAVPSRRKRPGLAVLLVAANVVLIGAVVFLVVQLANGSNGVVPSDVQRVGADEVASTDAGGTGLVGTGPALPIQAADVSAVAAGAANPTDAPDVISATEVVDTKTETNAPGVTVSAGALVGEALGALPFSVFEGELELVLRSQPPGATLTVAGFGSAPSPRTIRARRGVVVSGRATLADHAARTFEVVMGEEESHVVAMRPVPRGIVRFRFFPAEGTSVEIDGKPWSTSSNVVSAELSAGQHSLVLVAQSGKRVARSVVVEEGKTTNIGTIDLAGE
jgi:serine/threonine protein kinase